MIHSPNDACLASRDAAELTPFQVAMTVMGLNSNPFIQQSLAEHDQFSDGWESGVEQNLNLHPMPSSADTADDLVSLMAWTAGLVAGQYAYAKKYGTPYCILDHHGACDSANVDPREALSPGTYSSQN